MSSASTTVTYRGVNDVTLVADEWNGHGASEDGRPSILMLHGGGQNRFSWKNTGQILSEQGFHVVALDSRGHGDSDYAPGADQAGPEKVRQLVLVDVVPRYDKTGSARLRDFMYSHMSGFDSLDDAAA